MGTANAGAPIGQGEVDRLGIRRPCVAAITTDLGATYANGSSGIGATLTNAGTQVAFPTQDGVASAVSNRYLVMGQTTAAQNGVYQLTTLGSGSANWVLTRATSADEPSELIAGMHVIVSNPTRVKDYVLTATVTTVGTTAVTFKPASVEAADVIVSSGTPSSSTYLRGDGTWSTPAGGYTDPLTTKGDIVGRSASATVRIPVGTNGDALIANSADANGVSYGAANVYNNALLPSGALFQAYDRYAVPATNTGGNVVSGTLGVYAIMLPKGATLTSVTFISGTTAGASMTNQWACIMDSSRVIQAVSPDGTSGAWNASSAKTFTFSATYTTTYSGLYYVGLNVTGTTPPNLIGSTSPAFTALAEGLSPVVCGTSNTGQTTPLTVGTTASAFTGGRFKPYFYIS